jgi:hypothetical protein
MKSTKPFLLLIDTRVLLSLGVISMVFLVFLSFRIKHFEPCQEPTISVRADKLYVGEIIQFKTQENGKKTEYEWDFGDDSPIKRLGSSVGHEFSKPGRYQVRVKLSDNCMAFSTVNIENPPVLVDEKRKVNFSGPETIEVGKSAEFFDNTENATTWEWRFGESNKVDATSQKANYTYKKAGSKKVILTVNGNVYGEKIILVTEKPIVKTTAKPVNNGQAKPFPKIEPQLPKIDQKPSDVEKTPEIIEVPKIEDDEAINQFLMKLTEEGQSTKSLSKFFCDPDNLKFFYKGESLRVGQLDRELSKLRRSQQIKNLRIQTHRSGENNCVIILQITLNK